ncbi:MAG: prepilin-type N-terminal cleavage/methylation domain-containing protein [Betaproteobacteria bacterium]|nr:prepilin-type N-terminal cleavage/methylation domain-containing protein [Betaproteobacteria bacterium]
MRAIRTALAPPGSRSGAFTLIELLAVLAIIAVLLAIAAPRYFGSLDRAKEAVLKEDLYQMRDAIGKYYGDRGKYPDSLQTLVTDRYLRQVPADPITGSGATWIIIPPEDPDAGGVYDVRSGAPGRASNGTPYAEW